MGSGTFYFLFSVIPLKNGIHPSMDWERWIPYKVQSELDFYGMLKKHSRSRSLFFGSYPQVGGVAFFLKV